MTLSRLSLNSVRNAESFPGLSMQETSPRTLVVVVFFFFFSPEALTRPLGPLLRSTLHAFCTRRYIVVIVLT
jgi:hypothetical protein